MGVWLSWVGLEAPRPGDPHVEERAQKPMQEDGGLSDPGGGAVTCGRGSVWNPSPQPRGFTHSQGPGSSLHPCQLRKCIRFL